MSAGAAEANVIAMILVVLMDLLVRGVLMEFVFVLHVSQVLHVEMIMMGVLETVIPGISLLDMNV